MEKETEKIEFINFDKEKVLSILIELLADQEGAEIEYTLEKA